jgi:hypothetical protein
VPALAYKNDNFDGLVDLNAEIFERDLSRGAPEQELKRPR